MKKIFAAFAIAMMLSSANAIHAQVRVNVNFNLSSQPSWGPRGYDYVEYYYLPDIEAYYYVPTHQFIYLSGPNWIFSYSLPPRYSHYDLYSGYKVVINEPYAYRYFTTHKVRYSGYRGNHSQVIIRNSNAGKYKSNGYHGNGRAHGKGKGHGRH